MLSQESVVTQTEHLNQILIDAFNKFVPCKKVIIRPLDQPWSNKYTRLLLRRKNRNYQFYKKINADYNSLLNNNNTPPEILTKYLNKKNKAFAKSREAANASNIANRRVKSAFYNSVNCIMNNHEISAKKKFSILQGLMKNKKFSAICPLNENDRIINDSGEKAKIFNSHFASKSNLNGRGDDPPFL